MEILAPPRLSAEEYLAWEEGNFERHEYIDGEVRCMAGTNRRHSRIVWNLAKRIGQQVDDSLCAVHIVEMKVRSVGRSGIRYLYPDICAVCGEERYERDSEVVLLNPTVVIEVTSPSSIDYDRNDKRDFYYDVPSIEAYLIIDQHRPRADMHIRGAADWRVDSYGSLADVVPLEILDCALPLAQVYRGIQFGEG